MTNNGANANLPLGTAVQPPASAQATTRSLVAGVSVPLSANAQTRGLRYRKCECYDLCDLVIVEDVLGNVICTLPSVNKRS